MITADLGMKNKTEGSRTDEATHGYWFSQLSFANYVWVDVRIRRIVVRESCKSSP